MVKFVMLKNEASERERERSHFSPDMSGNKSFGRQKCRNMARKSWFGLNRLLKCLSHYDLISDSAKGKLPNFAHLSVRSLLYSTSSIDSIIHDHK